MASLLTTQPVHMSAGNTIAPGMHSVSLFLSKQAAQALALRGHALQHKGMLESGQGEACRGQLPLLQVPLVVCTAAGHCIQCAQQGAANDSKVPGRLLSLDLPKTSFLTECVPDSGLA